MLNEARSARRDTILRRIGRRVKRFLEPGALILNYHRIIDLPEDPYGICVPPAVFADHLQVLRRYAEPMQLRYLMWHLNRNKVPKRAVVVTFDDGYFDLAANARPLLERFDVPATAFVVSGFVGGAREFWWDELHALMGHAPEEEFRKVYDEAHEMRPKEREALLARLRNGSEQPAQRALYRGITPLELHALAEGHLVEIGAHTITHPSLPALSAAEQRAEIRGSRERLETVTAKSVTSFSYPHGRVDDAVVEQVREAGFACACASGHDLARPESPVYRLPRVTAHPWTGDEFAARLRFWFEGR